MINKKGVVISGLTTILLYFGFILLLILFFFIFKLSKESVEVKISGYIEDVDTNYEFLNYLRMPVKFDFDGKETESDMIDLIVKYYLSQGTENENKLQNLLGGKTKEIFNEKYPNLEWKLKVSDKKFRYLDGAKTATSSQTTPKITKEKTLVKGMAVVCMLIPNPDFENPIKIEFDFLNLNANAIEKTKYKGLKNNEFNC